MRKKYLARIAAVLLAVGMCLPSTEGTMFWSAVYAAETDAVGQDRETSDSYEVNSQETLTEVLENIQNSANKGTEQNPIDIKITDSFSADSTIVIPSETHIYLHGTVAFVGDNENAATTLKKSNSASFAVLQVDGTLILDTLRLAAVQVSESGNLTMNTGTVLQGGRLTNRGIATMNSGTIQGSTSGGVHNVGKFTMAGGNITGNQITSSKGGGYGGGVHNAVGAEFIMTGGNIYANTANRGGGVYNAGKMSLNGGSIYNNSALLSTNVSNNQLWGGGYGGGIYNDSAGELEFLGGIIGKYGYGNSAGQGGGVWTSGTFIMNSADAVISYNLAASKHTGRNMSCGGGVYIADGTFTLQNGKIESNKALSQGTNTLEDYDMGVFYFDGIMESGGGVYVANTGQGTGAVFVMEDGSIANNSAGGSAYGKESYSGDGGGVYVQGGKNEDNEEKVLNVTPAEFAMRGGVITGNTATEKGDGVYIGSSDSFGWVRKNVGGTNGKVEYRIPAEFTGSAAFSYGGSAVVYGNGTAEASHDLYLSNESRVQVAKALDPVNSLMKVAMQDTRDGAVLAAYAENGLYRASDLDRFALMDSRVMKYDSKTDQILVGKLSLEDGYELSLVDPEETFTYDGQPKTPAVKIQDKDGNVLDAGAYQVIYKENTDAGTATVTAQATESGGFSGSLDTTFEIAPRPFSEEYISIAESELTKGTYSVWYKSGEWPMAATQVKLYDTGLNKDLLRNGNGQYTFVFENETDENHPGETEWTASVAITGINNYTGTLIYDFTIYKKKFSDLENLKFSVGSDYGYTGKAIEPAVTVSDGDTALIKGTDYTVRYENNTDIGTAKIVITGIGKYLGEKELSFRITARSLSDASVSNIGNQTYTGQAICPAPTVKIGNTVLKNGTDYKLSYKDNINAGTATVTITGIGNHYNGQKTLTFSIVPKSISSASVQTIANQAYTGRVIRPTPTVKMGNTLLKKATHYTLSYSNNKKTGKATVKITGKGNYSGIRTVTFRIVPKKTTLKSAKSKKKQQLTVTWKKDAQASGYQIMIARNAKFTSSKRTKTITSKTKTSYTFSKLKKGKKYYVAVRAYKTIDKKKVYGAWSNYRTAVVKKK